MHYYSSADIATYILSRDDHEIANLTSEGIVELFDCDPLEILKQFEAQQQISLSGYVSRERVYRAAHKFRKHQVNSIKTLSYSLGFKDLNEFSSEFKRFFCIEPERYFYLMEAKRFKQNFYNYQ